MRKDKIINLLRSHQSDFKALGVKGMALFGSVARGDENEHSDVDFAIQFEDKVSGDLFAMGGVAASIESLIGTDHFDLAEENKLQPYVLKSYTKDRVIIF